MNRNDSPSEDGTNVVPISAEERRELEQRFDQLTCPNCDGAVRIAGKLAPDDQVDETKETLRTGLKGATIGGVAGAVAGPAGVAVGMSAGSLLGSAFGNERAQKKQLAVECDCCGYSGGAV